jgi:hypothetical protein
MNVQKGRPLPDQAELGNSAIARSFGARVGVTMPGQGLYLVIGHSSALSGLVRGAGGEIVLQLSARKLLAVLPITGYLAFRAHRDIAFIGPVMLDQERYAQFAAQLVRGTGRNAGDEIG